MNDREMLEYAAKAAGYRFRTDKDWNGRISSQIYIEKSGPSEHLCWNEWNPRADDKDAFRLAVKLSINVSFASIKTFGDIYAQAPDVPPVFEPVEGDVYAATREAIFRAAAEIGKAMEQNNG